MRSWWRHHRGHGSLISTKISPFLDWKRDNLIVSHPIVTKLDMNDGMGSVTNPYWWRHHWSQGPLISDKIFESLFAGIFDPFRVEIGQIWPQSSRKRIISAFRRAWPHVKIPTRTEVTAQNVSPIYSFLAHFWLCTTITSSIKIRSSPNLVGLLMCE